MTVAEADFAEFKDEDDHSLRELNLGPFNLVLAQLVWALKTEKFPATNRAADDIRQLFRFAARLGGIEVVVLAHRVLVEMHNPEVEDNLSKYPSEDLIEFSFPTDVKWGSGMSFLTGPAVRCLKAPDEQVKSGIRVPFDSLVGIRLRQPIEELP